MSNLPYYCSFVGSKKERFDGIILYLKDVKNDIESRREKQMKRREEILIWEKDLLVELNKEGKEIKVIVFLKSCIDKAIQFCNDEEVNLKSNINQFMMDLCEILL
jgi:hypothetical protein